MSRRTIVQLEDDLSGGEAAESVTFSLDGRSFEIDLNEKNAAALRESLAPVYRRRPWFSRRKARRDAPTLGWLCRQRARPGGRACLGTGKWL